ncbi:MAG TPA: hypothetical protein DIW50_05955 [Prolixibacteraceae bacterium]|nr:hypothetical protein [Prolixibacteraceae bacterium]
MLDIGFHDDILRILSYVPEKRQTLMFSATMPKKIRELASKILNEPVEISTEISKPAEGVQQAAYLVYNEQKIALIDSLISGKTDYDSILVFSSTKKNVFEIARALRKHGNTVKGISSDLEQKEREEVLMDFKAKRTRILVATDVLSRGIDIKDINLIINYDVPSSAEDYVHRVGRTARADKTGVAISLVNEKDMGKFHRIEQLIEREIIKLPLPEGLSEGPAWKAKSGGGGRRDGKRPFYGKKRSQQPRQNNRPQNKPSAS